jgi:TRAP-type C4-dicarboxylate transport system permease small subunit
MPVTQLLLRCDRVTTTAASIDAGLCLAAAVAAGFWQVVTRFLLENPAEWSEALVRLALIWMVMLGLSAALRQGALVSIDIAERLSAGLVRKAIRLAILIANLVMLVILIWFGITMAMRVTGQTMAGIEISIAWGYAAIPVGSAFAIIGALAHFVDRRNSELEASQ